MMPAAKMMDPVMGIDIHIIQPPGPVPPLPIPHPFVGMLFDPLELAPFIGASVFVNGMPKATAGSEGKALPPHIPIGGVFVPPPPGNECEMFMGSATVLFEGEPASYTALPALSCQSIGMPSPPRAKKKPKPILKLPTSVVLPIPAGPPVLIGGPPTISMTVIAMKAVMSGLGKVVKKLQSTKLAEAVARRIQTKAAKVMKDLKVPPNARRKVHTAICTVTGHPVDVATGKVFTENLDFELAGSIPLKWERAWFSTSTYDGPLGHGWHLAYDLALAVDRNSAAVRLPDGRPLGFPALDPGQSSYNRSEKLTLVRSGNDYSLRDQDRNTYRFGRNTTAKGEHPLIAIEDASGRRISFAYDAQGHLEALQDTAGRLLRIHTDWHGRILRVEAPDPELPGQTITLMAYRYDDRGDLIEAQDASGHAWRYAYHRHLLVSETDRNGLTFRFSYDGEDASAKCLRTWGDGGIYDHKLAYDEAGRTTTVTDSLGHKTRYHWTEAGLVTRVDDARGGSSVTGYNGFNEVETVVDELGRTTRYAYDARGNLIRVENPDGSRLEFQYQGDRKTATLDALGGAWKWEYDDKERPLQRTDPLGRVTSYRYDGPFLTSLVDPAGLETRFRYGPSGELAAMVTPDGAESRWEYDGLGRCTAVVDPKGNIQRRMVDRLGRVRKVEEPDGNVRDLEYDGEGNVVRVRDRHEVIFRYQGMGRMASRTEHGTTVEFHYDTEERLVGIRNEHGSVYGFELDPLGDLAVETGFDGVRRKYRRDIRGRVAAVERATGFVSEFAYDQADRVVEVRHSDGEKEVYKYRADGEQVEATNRAMKVVFERDALGRVLKEDQGGRVVESRYDLLGRRVEVRSSQGGRQRIERSELGAVNGLAYGRDGKSSEWEARFTRDILGLEVERALPGGIKSRWTRDKVGRPLRHLLISGNGFRARDYQWDVDDRLKSLRDSRQGQTAFEHDPVGNLLWSVGSDGTHLFRLPDAVGNLFRSPDRDDRKYGQAGQLLEARGSAGTTRYEYDSEGNLVRKVEPGGKVWTYHWNCAGMLEKVVRPEGLEVEFTYDALGRRVGKKFRGQTTRWVWDGNLPLHEWVEEGNRPASGGGSPDGMGAAEAAIARRQAEAAGNPAVGPPREDAGTAESPVTWLFEPETFSPMAKLVGEKRLSIVSDHLGAPLAMFDAEGRETWSAQIDIYGRITDLKETGSTCPFRFPGQYEDSETGLHYNRFRYYDPEAGLFISPDPIGLAGGHNLFAYVKDPLAWDDPLGLAPTGRNGIPSLSDADLLQETQDLMYRDKRAPGNRRQGTHGLVHRYKEQMTGAMRPGSAGWDTHEQQIKNQQKALRERLRELEKRNISPPKNAWKVATQPPPRGNQKRIPGCMK